MIEYIRGKIDSLHPATVVIEANGVGYEIGISLYTFNALQSQKEAKIYIHEVLREDTHDLYGFFDMQERALFRLLITVNGVGANTARLILSSYSPPEIGRHISDGNTNALKAVKGIGTKTAERLIVELKDKILTIFQEEAIAAAGGAGPSMDPAVQAEREEAISAFVVLGYPQAAARKVVAALFKQYPDMPLNQKIKKGLTMF